MKREIEIHTKHLSGIDISRKYVDESTRYEVVGIIGDNANNTKLDIKVHSQDEVALRVYEPGMPNSERLSLFKDDGSVFDGFKKIASIIHEGTLVETKGKINVAGLEVKASGLEIKIDKDKNATLSINGKCMEFRRNGVSPEMSMLLEDLAKRMHKEVSK